MISYNTLFSLNKQNKTFLGTGDLKPLEFPKFSKPQTTAYIS